MRLEYDSTLKELKNKNLILLDAANVNEGGDDPDKKKPDDFGVGKKVEIKGLNSA